MSSFAWLTRFFGFDNGSNEINSHQVSKIKIELSKVDLAQQELTKIIKRKIIQYSKDPRLVKTKDILRLILFKTFLKKDFSFFTDNDSTENDLFDYVNSQVDEFLREELEIILDLYFSLKDNQSKDKIVISLIRFDKPIFSDSQMSFSMGRALARIPAGYDSNFKDDCYIYLVPVSGCVTNAILSLCSAKDFCYIYKLDGTPKNFVGINNKVVENKENSTLTSAYFSIFEQSYHHKYNLNPLLKYIYSEKEYLYSNSRSIILHESEINDDQKRLSYLLAAMFDLFDQETSHYDVSLASSYFDSKINNRKKKAFSIINFLFRPFVR